jgi:glycosyltransferase involved in cell wall biosynthesis
MAARRVLFLETGIVGGGSFESLYQTLRVLNRKRFEPLAAFFNRTRYLEMVRDLGLQAFLLTDPAYTKSLPRFLHRRAERASDRAFRKGAARAERTMRLCHWTSLRALARIIREQGVELFYLNTQINRDLFACLAAADAGIPVVSHQRSLDGASFCPEKAAFANAHVAAYVSNSAVTKAYWEGRGIDPAKSRLVFNAVPRLEVPALDVRREFGIPAGRAVVACVARLVPVKNHELLLRAFARLIVSRPETALLLVGEGSERRRLESLARDLGLEGRAVFAGFRQDAQAIIAGSDLLVLPSSNDSFGRVLIEAMQLDVPVIGAAAGGIPDIIQDGRNGLLAPADDAGAWAGAMERLLSDQGLRQSLAAGGRESVATTFDLQRCTAQLEDILEGVLAAGGRDADLRERAGG